MTKRDQVRQFALDVSAKEGRPFTRVSKEFLDEVEADLRVMIIRKIRTRPSIGVTLK